MFIGEANFNRGQNNFDVLRLSAAIMVFTTHSFGIRRVYAMEPLNILTNGVYNLSNWGLFIFFTVSGFLLSRSITRSSVRNYLLNRFLRICPAIAVCSILTILIPGWIFTTFPGTVFFSHPETWRFLLQNSFPARVVMSLPGVFEGNAINPSLWSIPVEIKFYVLLALAFLLGVLNKKALVAGVWVMLVILFNQFNKEIRGIGGTFQHLHSLLYMGEYFLGGVVFYLYRDKIPVRFSIWLLLLAILLLVWKLNPDYLQIPATFLFIYTIIGLGVTNIHTPFPRIDISYGFYLYAYPVQSSIQYALGNQLSFWQYFLITLLITAAFGAASWFLVEKKALTLKVHRRTLPVEKLIAQPEDKTYQHKQ